MTLEEAIRTALDYERKIRDIYFDAAEKAEDPTGRRVFKNLGQDEQRHVDYLESRLVQWEKTGAIDLDELEAAVPDMKRLLSETEGVAAEMAREDRKDEKQMLSKALQAELETSDFYRRMVDTLDEDGRRLFSRFLAIEQGHIEAVQAELDYLSRTGYWLGFKEFDME